MADSFKRISGGPGVQPPEAVRLCNLRALKYLKLMLKALKSITPIYTIQVPWIIVIFSRRPWLTLAPLE